MNNLIKFLNKSVNEYVTCSNITNMLDNEGFIKLNLGEKWDLYNNKNYYVVSNESSVIAFKMPQKLDNISYNITATHLDSPVLKIKHNGVINQQNCSLFNIEVYGGPILKSWFDRPLGVAGRVFLLENEKIVSKIVVSHKPIGIIPNPSIHLKKDFQINPQLHMLPIFSLEKKNMIDVLEELFGLKDIISYDLSLYIYEDAKLVGLKDELICSSRLDDLECVHAQLTAFLNTDNHFNKVNVCCVFNNEEVGSNSIQGAGSSLLKDILERISKKDNLNENLYNSFMLSIDNAHSSHPNHLELSDPTNNVFINKGVVIKSNTQLRYTTDALSLAFVKKLCLNSNIDVQYYSNRSDQLGGSTLGHILQSSILIHSCDIGLAQFAMHSAYETAGVKDYFDLIQLVEEFYQSSFKKEDNKIVF